jgi:hypothetical protein
MNKKIIIFTIIILGLTMIGGGAYFYRQNRAEQIEQVREVVLAFGKKLQMVSLLAPNDILISEMKDNYSDFVSPGLLSLWENDVSKIPGRLTSSPWPDRIEISSITRNKGGSYSVEGRVIEITSKEVVSGGIADQYSVNITVQKTDGKWLITDFERGAYE